ncbi:MAG: FG-GAP-like repeat-containing protein [Flavobacteriales bacterium]
MKITVLVATTFLVGLHLQAQDTCADALPIGPGLHTVTAINGTENTPINCAEVFGTGVSSAAEWYTYTATADTNIFISTDLSGFPSIDTRVQVYTGTCGNLSCLDGDDDGGSGTTSYIVFAVETGTTYTIAFDNRWTSNGFTFELGMIEGPPPALELISFTGYNSGLTGTSRAVVDMNNDGLDDIVGVSATNVHILQQLEGGGFTSVNIPTTQADNTPSWSLAAGDIDGNGYNDLLYGGGQGATFMMANDEGTGFTEVSFPEYIFSQRTNMVDLNNDGHLDAFVCHDVDANVSFMNDGTGNLTFGQGGFGLTCGNYGSVFVDYDNDGDVDCFVAKCGCDPADLLMRNNGDGTFTDVAPLLGFADNHQSWSSAWGDYDNDGDMDVLIGSSSSGYHKLMGNNGDGTFTNITVGSGVDLFTGQSIEWTTHDFDNNGYLDIFGGGAMLMNNGDMTFSMDNTVPANGSVGDLNDDGFLDVVNGATVMYNDGNDNNWIKVITTGTVSNRNGIGARVMITSAMGTQIRDVKSGDGFRYMSSLTTHFGIGTDNAIETVEIHWPSGNVDIVENPSINTTIEVVETVTTAVAERNNDVLNLYPVPATDQLTVSGKLPANSPVRIVDATGRMVLMGVLTGNTLDVSSLPNGVYLLEVELADGPVKRSFVKQ